jgi:hypothetical protein
MQAFCHRPVTFLIGLGGRWFAFFLTNARNQGNAARLRREHIVVIGIRRRTALRDALTTQFRPDADTFGGGRPGMVTWG